MAIAIARPIPGITPSTATPAARLVEPTLDEFYATLSSEPKARFNRSQAREGSARGTPPSGPHQSLENISISEKQDFS
jgi:hypothetical protein